MVIACTKFGSVLFLFVRVLFEFPLAPSSVLHAMSSGRAFQRGHRWSTGAGWVSTALLQAIAPTAMLGTSPPVPSAASPSLYRSLSLCLSPSRASLLVPSLVISVRVFRVHVTTFSLPPLSCSLVLGVSDSASVDQSWPGARFSL